MKMIRKVKTFGISLMLLTIVNMVDVIGATENVGNTGKTDVENFFLVSIVFNILCVVTIIFVVITLVRIIHRYKEEIYWMKRLKDELLDETRETMNLKEQLLDLKQKNIEFEGKLDAAISKVERMKVSVQTETAKTIGKTVVTRGDTSIGLRKLNDDSPITSVDIGASKGRFRNTVTVEHKFIHDYNEMIKERYSEEEFYKKYYGAIDLDLEWSDDNVPVLVDKEGGLLSYIGYINDERVGYIIIKSDQLKKIPNSVKKSLENIYTFKDTIGNNKYLCRKPAKISRTSVGYEITEKGILVEM